MTSLHRSSAVGGLEDSPGVDCLEIGGEAAPVFAVFEGRGFPLPTPCSFVTDKLDAPASESDDAKSAALLRRRIPALHHLQPAIAGFSCWGVHARRDLFLRVLEQVRHRYRFVVVGYVVMPEHVHLLISEPDQASKKGNPGTVIQVLKQRFARSVLREMRQKHNPAKGLLWHDPVAEAHVWQARFFDFVVFTAKKRWEKLHYIHQNPVKRELVLRAEQWRWSSSRHYVLGERGPVLVNEALRAGMRVRNSSGEDSSAA